MSSTRSISLREQGLTALTINWDIVAAVILFLVSFALYAQTAAPGVLDGDFGEFQTNTYLLGVSHTGYPLYFLLSKFWTMLMPVGSIAYRANVFSGFFGAATLVLLFSSLRTLKLSLLVSLASAVLFGVSRVQWSQAILPDVYTLNSFFIVLVIWLAVLWRMGRVPLWWLALAYGLSLTHHRTMITIAPALGLFVLWGGGRTIFEPRTFLKAAAALLLPLLLYVYIPLRAPSVVGVEYHASQFTDMILASNVSVWMRYGPPGFLWERFTQVYLPLMVEQFTLIGYAFGWVGVAALALRRVPRDFPATLPPLQFLLLVGLAHIGETAFAIPFWVFDSEIFFIPSYLTFLFFVALGFEVAYQTVRGRLANLTAQRVWSGFAALLLVVLCGYVLWVNYPRNDWSRNDEPDARWQEILAQPLEENALIMGPWEDLTPLEYYQFVEGERTDLKRDKVVIYRDQLSLVNQENLADRVARMLADGQSVYLTRHPLDVETMPGFEQWDATAFESLWRIQPRPGRQGQLRQAFGQEENIRVLAVFPNQPQAGEFLSFLLNWSPEAPIGKLRMVIRLRDSAGRIWLEREILPMGGRQVNRAESTGRDLHGLIVPPDAPPGEYRLEVAAFERNSQTPYALIGESNEITQEFIVRPPDVPTNANRLSIEHPLTAALAAGQFLGYDVSNPEPSGGDVLEFSSWWQNLADPSAAFEIKMADASDTESVLYSGALFPEASGGWNAAQIARSRHEITIPPTAAAGYAQLLLSLNGEALPPIRIALGESQRKFRVPIIQRPQLTMFGEAMQLLGYKLDRTQVRAGEKLPVTLYWSAHQKPEASYKVFVHLVDANGQLRAQQDALPKNNTLPTDRWFAGEYVTDEYVLDLPPDLGTGDYRIVVGMYDPNTGERVLLADPNGLPIAGDSVVLGDVIQVR